MKNNSHLHLLLAFMISPKRKVGNRLFLKSEMNEKIYLKLVIFIILKNHLNKYKMSMQENANKYNNFCLKMVQEKKGKKLISFIKYYNKTVP